MGTNRAGRLPEGASPRRYHVPPTFRAETVADCVGLRGIERRGTPLRLNVRPLRLRGICVHAHDSDTGRITGEADIRRRVAQFRALGGKGIHPPQITPAVRRRERSHRR